MQAILVCCRLSLSPETELYATAYQMANAIRAAGWTKTTNMNKALFFGLCYLADPHLWGKFNLSGKRGGTSKGEGHKEGLINTPIYDLVSKALLMAFYYNENDQEGTKLIHQAWRDGISK